MKKLMAGLALLAVLGAGYFAFGRKPGDSGPDGAAGAAIVQIALPGTLSANAQIGQTIFQQSCAECHGQNAVGQDGVAPPLVHKIYEPSHHGDESFQRAVAAGVRSHHWRFGNMPPVQGLTRGDVTMILAYVRELQRANGIF